jgi:hypothetical protein
MDFSSHHLLYIIGAFVLAGGILTTLLLGTLRADRKAQLDLEKWASDEAEA